MSINSKFFKKKREFLTLAEILKFTNSILEEGNEGSLSNKVFEVATLDNAIEGEISFLHSAPYFSLLENSKAGYCFLSQKYLPKKPKNIKPLIHDIKEYKEVDDFGISDREKANLKFQITHCFLPWN